MRTLRRELPSKRSMTWKTSKLTLVLLPAGALAFSPGILPGRACAGLNSGGVLVVHHDPKMTMTNHCDPGLVPSTPSELRPQAPRGDEPVFWIIAAAFPDSLPNRLAGCAFGLGDYDTTKVRLAAWGICGGGAPMEMSGAGWPGPRTGNSVVFDARGGKVIPLYWFMSYAYADAAVPLAPNPTQGGAWGDTSLPARLDPIYEYGVMGFGAEKGHNPRPSPGAYLFAVLFSGEADPPVSPDSLPGIDRRAAASVGYDRIDREMLNAREDSVWNPASGLGQALRPMRVVTGCYTVRAEGADPGADAGVMVGGSSPAEAAGSPSAAETADGSPAVAAGTSPAEVGTRSYRHLDGSEFRASAPEANSYIEGPGWVLVFCADPPIEQGLDVVSGPRQGPKPSVDLFDRSGRRVMSLHVYSRTGDKGENLGIFVPLSVWSWLEHAERDRQPEGRDSPSEAGGGQTPPPRRRFHPAGPPVPLASGPYFVVLRSPEAGRVEWTRVVVVR